VPFYKQCYRLKKNHCSGQALCMNYFSNILTCIKHGCCTTGDLFHTMETIHTVHVMWVSTWFNSRETTRAFLNTVNIFLLLFYVPSFLKSVDFSRAKGKGCEKGIKESEHCCSGIFLHERSKINHIHESGERDAYNNMGQACTCFYCTNMSSHCTILVGLTFFCWLLFHRIIPTSPSLHTVSIWTPVYQY